MKEQEWVRHDTGDFRQGRDDDMGEEAERQERREMADPVFLSEGLDAQRSERADGQVPPEAAPSDGSDPTKTGGVIRPPLSQREL
jgi:hypothetical protein